MLSLNTKNTSQQQERDAGRFNFIGIQEIVTKSKVFNFLDCTNYVL